MIGCFLITLPRNIFLCLYFDYIFRYIVYSIYTRYTIKICKYTTTNYNIMHAICTSMTLLNPIICIIHIFGVDKRGENQ